MKINKTIVIICVAAILLCVAVGITTYNIALNSIGNGKNVDSQSGIENSDTASFTLGEYTMHFGTYKGYAITYDWDDDLGQAVETGRSEITLKLNSDSTYEINGDIQSYSVDGANIIANGSGTVIFDATGNDTLNYHAGSGIELTYCGE